MARYTRPVCRLCRREGIKLMLKGIRCETAKCPMERQWRSQPPGMHAWRRSKTSEYGVRLREKQKVKRYYGVLEKQFMNYFHSAERTRGNTGETLLQFLERRLDNVVCKMGFCASRKTARLAIGHGHIYVNGHKVDRPSFLVSSGDRVTVKPSDRSVKYLRRLYEDGGSRPVQQWLQMDAEKLEGVVMAMPTREDVQIPVEDHLIVELCSR